MKIEPIGNGLYGGTYQGRYVVVDERQIIQMYYGNAYNFRLLPKNPHFEVIKKLLYSYENN